MNRERTRGAAGPAEDISGSPRWLVRAKLDPPHQQILLIDRPQLIDQLARILDHPLGLITAPAGFGKTTLLAQWRRSLLKNGVKVAWVSLDEADGDARQFLAYVIFALAAAGVDLGRLEMLAQQGLIDMAVAGGIAVGYLTQYHYSMGIPALHSLIVAGIAYIGCELTVEGAQA